MFGFLKKKDAPKEVPSGADAPAPAGAAAPATGERTWAQRLKAWLAKTRSALNTPLSELFSRARIDDELL